MFRVVRNLRKYANDEAQGVAAVKRRAAGFFTASEAARRVGHCRETIARGMDLGGIRIYGSRGAVTFARKPSKL